MATLYANEVKIHECLLTYFCLEKKNDVTIKIFDLYIPIMIVNAFCKTKSSKDFKWKKKNMKNFMYTPMHI